MSDDNSVDHGADPFSAVTWRERPVSLKNFAANNTLPGLAMIVKGRYRSIGSVSNTESAVTSPSDDATVFKGSNEVSCSNIIFIQSIEKAHKILMETAKPNPGGRHVVSSSGRKFSLPLTYQGLFEVLSEDGRPCRPLKTVAELVRVWPRECVVRENARALVSGPPNAGGGTMTRLERFRVIQAGERLILHDQVTVNLEPQSGKSASSTQSVRQYLRCIDDQGNTVFLNLNQKVRISPVAGANNISGVHDIVSLLEKFRLPVTVHLVCGFIPPKIDKTFTPVFRLLGFYEDETAFVLPVRLASASASLPAVHRNSGPDNKTEPPLIVGNNVASVIHAAGRMLTISTSEPLYLVGARNAADLETRPDFRALRQRSDAMVAGYANSIHVLVPEMQPDVESLARSTDQLRVVDGDTTTEGSMVRGRDRHAETSSIDRNEIETIFDEIDDIYRYVREGGDPPTRRTPPRARRNKKVERPSSDQSWVMQSNMDIGDDTEFPLNSPADYEYDDEDPYQRIDDVVPTTTTALKTARKSQRQPTGNKDKNETGGWTNTQECIWEEPVYADIGQIRERKRIARQGEEHWATVDGGSPAAVAASSRPNDAGEPDAFSDEINRPLISHATTVTTSSEGDLHLVGNLRQLIKRDSLWKPSTNPSASTHGDVMSKSNDHRHPDKEGARSLQHAPAADHQLYGSKVGKTTAYVVGASLTAEIEDGQANVDLGGSLPPSSATSPRTATPYYLQPSVSMPHHVTAASNELSTLNSTLKKPNNVEGFTNHLNELLKRPTVNSTSSSTTTVNRHIVTTAALTSPQTNLIIDERSDFPGGGAPRVQPHQYQQPIEASSFNSSWFDPTDSSAFRPGPGPVLHGTTAVVVSRSKPSLVHQHHYRAGGSVPVDHVAPVSGLSRVAVVGGTPANGSPGSFNVRHQPAQFVNRHQTNSEAPPPAPVVAHGVTRISTLNGRLGGNLSDRAQPAV